MPFSKWLETGEPQRIVWQTSSHSVNASQLLSWQHASVDIANSTRSKNVALVADDAETLLSLIGLMDGIANLVLILPSDLTNEQLLEFLQIARTEVLVSAEPLATETPAPIQVIEVANRIQFDNHSIDNSGPILTKYRVYDTNWVLATSGTTGAPKLVSHRGDTLTRSIRTGAEARYRWGLLYDVRRFAGLQVALQALAAHETLLLPDTRWPLPKQLEFLQVTGCNALSATPTLWRKILMTEGGLDLKLQQITLGGEIVDQPILSALKRSYPEARITHIYASTEAGVGFSVKDARSGFPIEFLRNPQNGVELSVSSDGHLLLRATKQGQQYLTPNSVLYDESDWIDTGDLVRQDDDRFYFLGRANGSINVGGNKVFPEEVEQLVRTVEGVADCIVKGRRNSFSGMLVEAVVVPSEPTSDHRELAKSIKQKCASVFPSYKVPAIITFADTIQTAATGKGIR